MKRKNAARNALFTSILSLLLCVSMLVGTTFAWFTDSVTSAGNKVVAGNLDVDLYQWTAADASTEITNESDPLFAESILWEPGKTQVVYLSIKNNGSLSLKYKVSVSAKDTDAGQDLYEAMRYAIIPDAKFATVTAWDATNAKAVVPGINATEASSVNMAPNDEHFFALAIHMNEEAGNKYQGGSVAFDIRVDATQLTAESDSFGTDYDADAALPVYAIGTAPVVTGGTTEIVVENKNAATPVKVAVVNVPEDAVADEVEEIKVTVTETEDPAGFVVSTNEASVTYDVEVTGINGEQEVTVELFVGKGLTGVVLYHNSVEMVSAKYTYDPDSGYVTFKSATFSPFTVVYDAVEEPAAPSEPSTPGDPAVLPEGIPLAVVTDVTRTVNVGPWKSAGSIPSANEAQDLAVVYKYECSPDEYDAKYDDWYCDFYVSVNRNIEADQLFLGGEYGTWGWIGFNAPAVNKDIEVALLASAVNGDLVTRGGGSDTGWTYEAVKDFVGVFHCGVAQVYNSTADLSGLEFTVKLSLTNPENPNEFYNVSTINYTFKNSIDTEDDLKAALANGGEVLLADDIVLTDTITVPAGVSATLNLNGHTISQAKACTDSYSMISNNGNLTITGNGTVSFEDTGAGDPDVGWASYTIRNSGTLTIENGTIEHLGKQTYNGNNAIFNYSGSTTINGGYVEAPFSRSVRLWNGSVTINNGTFNGQVWVQAMSNCSLTINGGSFKPATNGNDGSSVYVTNDTHNVALSVTDGSFATKIGCADASKLAGCITGGMFTESAKANTDSTLFAETFA